MSEPEANGATRADQDRSATGDTTPEEPHFPPPIKRGGTASETASSVAGGGDGASSESASAKADGALLKTESEPAKADDALAKAETDPAKGDAALVKAESDADKAESDADKAESDADKADGALAKAEADPAKTEEEPTAPPAPRTAPSPQPAEGPLVRGRLAELGAILSGALYCIAFAGIDVWPLTFVAFVPLYLSLFGQTPKRATWLGLLAGISMNVGGFYWLVNMLKTFSGFPLPACLFFTFVICTYQGGRLALMGWLHGRATSRGWPAPLVFAAAFVASEIAYPLLFPWYYAATVHKVPVLMQLADVGGPILVGLVLVAVNLAVAEPLRARLAAGRELAARTIAGPSSEERLSLAIDRRVVGVGVLAMLVALVYGAARISMTNARIEKAESAVVGYVQGNMSLMGKRENPGEGLRRHRQMTAELRDKGADLVVWSETSATFPTREDMATKGNFFRDRFAASLGVPTIFGAVLYRVDPDRERWFNSAIGTDVKGDIRGRYDKQYLLAFGEYLPFGESFPILYKWSPHSGRFSPGKSFDPLPMIVKGVERKISVLICYEDILPGFTNRMVAHADPELLVNMTNDAWFGDTTEPWQHLALAKFRAVEHRRYLVRATNSGVSAIIDPNGRIVEGTLSSTFKAEANTGVVHWLRGGTIYETVGDVPWYLVTLGIAVAAFRRRRAA